MRRHIGPARSWNSSGTLCRGTGRDSLNVGTIRRPESFFYKQATPVDLIYPPGTADLAMPVRVVVKTSCIPVSRHAASLFYVLDVTSTRETDILLEVSLPRSASASGTRRRSADETWTKDRSRDE